MSKIWLAALLIGVSTAGPAFARIPLLSSKYQPTGIATDSERLSQKDRYVAVPNFPKDSIEFIRDGLEDKDLMLKYLTQDTVSYIRTLNLQWLQVRDVRIDKNGIVNVEDGVLVPIVAGVRYMQTQNWIDGTANALFHVTNKNGKLNVELVNYDDNSAEQVIGRFASGIDFNHLLNSVAGDTLRVFFSVPGNPEALMQLRTAVMH